MDIDERALADAGGGDVRGDLHNRDVLGVLHFRGQSGGVDESRHRLGEGARGGRELAVARAVEPDDQAEADDVVGFGALEPDQVLDLRGVGLVGLDSEQQEDDADEQGVGLVVDVSEFHSSLLGFVNS